MAVRPFYIEADIEGRKTPLAGGTARKNGEHHISIHQRETKERLQLLLRLNSTPKSKMVS